MNRVAKTLVRFVMLSAVALPPGFAACPQAQALPPNRKPDWDEIAKVITAHFAQVPGHHAYALITQSDVGPLWVALSKRKWNVPQAERDRLTKLIPTDKEFFVERLHTAKGRAFMRNVATRFPEIYDRLDLLSRATGGGKPAVSGLIAAPDARQTVSYMFSKSGERSWAALLPEKNSFNKPTGRIYTAESLAKELQQLYGGS